MGKTSPYTGTQKKAIKELAKLSPKLAKETLKQYQRSGRYEQRAQKQLRDISEGEKAAKYKPTAKYEPEKFEPKAKFEAEKFKPKTKYETTDLKQLQKDFGKAMEGARELYEPTRQAALRQFQTDILPSVKQAAGASEVKTSSALRQALGAASENLASKLNEDFTRFQTNLAGNLLNAREQSRQFGAGFGSQQEQFGANLRAQQAQFGAGFQSQAEQYAAQLRNQQQQFGSNFYNQQQQFGTQMGLQNLDQQLRAAAAMRGQILPAQQYSPPPAYNQKQGGSSQDWGSAIGGLGQAGAAIITAASASSREVKENIRDYEKGLDVVRDLDVKQYDYIIPVDGRRNDRVGLIAEDVPDELQAMLGPIKGVDVYGLVALLVNAVKQLDEKVKMLEAK